MLGLRTLRALEEGRFDDAPGLAERAYAVGRLADERTARHYLGAQRTILHYCTGEWGELAGPLQSFVDQYPNLPTWRCALALLHAELGRPDAARRELDLAGGRDWSKVPRDSTWLLGVCRASETAAIVGDDDHLSVLYDLLLPFADRYVVLGRVASIGIGPAARFLGMMATAMGRHDDAVAHCERAIALATRAGARPWLGHARHDCARALLGRDAPGDRERAFELLEDARALAEELGMPSLVEMTRAVEGAARG
jgi:tetratricopeptide (TPR) repeat protein